jgi:hypothetical protein
LVSTQLDSYFGIIKERVPPEGYNYDAFFANIKNRPCVCHKDDFRLSIPYERKTEVLAFKLSAGNKER